MMKTMNISNMTDYELEQLRKEVSNEIEKRENIRIDELMNKLHELWMEIRDADYEIYYNSDIYAGDLLNFDEISIC